jgi:hypothetical protein
LFVLFVCFWLFQDQNEFFPLIFTNYNFKKKFLSFKIAPINFQVDTKIVFPTKKETILGFFIFLEVVLISFIIIIILIIIVICTYFKIIIVNC